MKRIGVFGVWVLWCGCAADTTSNHDAPDAEADAIEMRDGPPSTDARVSADALASADAQVARDARVTPDLVDVADVATLPDATSLEGSFSCDGTSCASGELCVRQYGGDAGALDVPPVEPVGHCTRAPSPCADLVDCNGACVSTCAQSACGGVFPLRVQGRAVWCPGA